jgi:hypothetical protein
MSNKCLLDLKKNNLFYKFNKCEFNVLKVKFLSFIIKIKSVRADFKRIYSIIKWLKLKLFYNI